METVRVQGFQSLEDVTIELGRMTTVEGDSRAGKSALVRCLRVWAYNAKSVAAFVRHGEKHFLVTVDIDGHKVVCKRGEGVTHYELDGEAFEKIGFSVPEAVFEATGFRVIQYDKDLVLPLQIQGQFDAPFLLGEQWSGPAITKVLGSVSRIDVIYRAQRIARKRQRATQQSIREKQEQAVKLEEQLKEYAAIDEQIRMVEEAENKLRYAVAADMTYEKMCRVRADHDAAQERLDALEEPTSDPTEAWRYARQIRSSLTDWAELLDVRNNVADARSVLAGIKEPTTNPVAARKQVETIQAELQVFEELQGLRKDHTDAANAVAKALQDIGEAKSALARANKAKADFFNELGTCPFCGSVIRSEATA